ncbi:winged helix-turn-helix transcriptional regulator [Vibrio sp. SCSIO 43136]|nr:winged helix-turn-helix transcriptional regulator [Vibrio sp. SCSIO 43136]
MAVSDIQATEADLAREKRFAEQAKALSHPVRVRILKMLHQLDNYGVCLNGDLVAELGLAQSTVSEHLRILKNAELVIAESNPPRTCYRIHRQNLAGFQALFGDLFG